VFGADVSIMTMIVKASKDRTDRDDAAGWGLLAYAWNPLILMTVPLGGMADVAIAAAFIGALLARRRGRTGVATVLLTLASLIKVYAAVGLLLHLVLLARERKWKVASRHAAVAAALTAAAYAPYWAGLKTFRAVLNVANLTNHSLMGTLQRLLVPVFQATGFADPINDAAAAVRWLAAPLLLGVVIWTVAKVRSEPELWHGVLIVLAAYTYLTPWYLYWYIVAPAGAGGGAASQPADRAAPDVFRHHADPRSIPPVVVGTGGPDADPLCAARVPVPARTRPAADPADPPTPPDAPAEAPPSAAKPSTKPAASSR